MRLPPKVSEDLLDHRLLQGGGNWVQVATKMPAESNG